jgi:tetratricopeptide (TPR) repeat protein
VKRPVNPLPHIFAALLTLLLAGCSSVGDDQFLLASLDQPAKARTLTEIGISEYQVHLVRRVEYDQIDEVRQYFEAALRYDPSNTLAKKYLAVVTNFRETNLKASLKEAVRYGQKAKRTDDETYLLCLAVQKAARIDPKNPDVQKLVGDTVAARGAFVEETLARSKAATDKIDEKSSDAVREKLTIEAFQFASRALAVDPLNADAQVRMTALRSSLSQIAVVNDFNRRLDGSFEADVRTATYTLNYRWAKTLFDQKEYTQAEVKADAALAVKRTDEAAALKKKIAALRTQTETATSFESALQDVDRLIAKGVIVSLSAAAPGPGRLASLDDRSERVRGNLKPLYDQAVEAYRGEDFKAAIELLETVVAIDESYEQAADYLDKAQSKQKLLEQF